MNDPSIAVLAVLPRQAPEKVNIQQLIGTEGDSAQDPTQQDPLQVDLSTPQPSASSAP